MGEGGAWACGTRGSVNVCAGAGPGGSLCACVLESGCVLEGEPRGCGVRAGCVCVHGLCECVSLGGCVPVCVCWLRVCMCVSLRGCVG